MDLVDAAARDRWVLGPEVAQVHPGLLPIRAGQPEHAEPRVGPVPPAACRGIRLPRVRDPSCSSSMTTGAARPEGTRRDPRTRRRAGSPPRTASQAAAPARSRSGTLPVEVAQALPDVNLPGPGDLLLRIGRTLLPLGEPAGHASDREQHREHRHREAHGLVDDARVEVHVRVQLVADEVVVGERDPLELQRDVQQRVAPGDLEHLVGHLLDEGRPRVIIPVHPVAEPDQAQLARLDPGDVVGHAGDGPDLPQHLEHLLVRPAVQRAVQRRGRRGRRGIRVAPGAGHAPHRARGTVLLMVGVQDEQHVQGVLEHRVRVVLELGHLPHHVEEVARVGQVVVGIVVRKALRVPVREGRERRHLGDEPHDLLVLAGPVVDRLGLGVEGGQRRQGADQDAHRVSVVVEAVDELLDVLVHVGVIGDLAGPRRRLSVVRHFAAQQQEGHVQERGPAGQLLDRVAAVAQDAFLPVDERDGTAAARGVLEGGVVGQQSEVVIGCLDLP